MLKKCFFIWIFFLSVYLLVSSRGTLQWDTTAKNYFSLQAYSLVRGHIDLIALPKDLYDLSIYNRKAFLYWPPLPSFFALPFVILGGIGVSDIFYTAFWASFGPLILYLVLHEAKNAKFIPPITEMQIFLLTLFFAFGTVYFYLSVLGTVWFTSQITAILMLLVSLMFLFKFAGSKKNKSFILSILFLCLAFWARNTLILLFPLYFYVLFTKGTNSGKKKLFFIASAIIAASTLLFGFYNYVRFASFTENGLKYQTFNARWKSDVENYGLSNLRYFPHNVYYFLLHPLQMQFKFPYIAPDPEGNSIFTTSPLFLLIFGLINKKYFKKKNIPLFMYLGASLLLLVPVLFYYGTGWFQFGYRYALDAIPLIILGLAYVIEAFPNSFVILLVSISVIINTLGTFWMQSLAGYLYF